MALFRSIRSKIILGVVALLVLMAVSLTVVATERTEAALEEYIVQTQHARATKIAQDLEGFVQSTHALAAKAVEHPAFIEPIPEAQRGQNGTVPASSESAKREVLRQLVRTGDQFENIVAYDLEGLPYLSYPTVNAWTVAETPPEDGVPRAFILAQLLNQSKQPSFITRGTDPGSWDLVAMVRDAEGRPWAMLVFHARLDALAPVLPQGDLGAAEKALVMDDQGTVLASSSGYTPGDDLRSQFSSLSRAPGGTDLVTLGGKEHLASRVAADGTAWSVVLSIERAVAFAAVDEILRSTVLISLVALVVGVTLSLVLGHDVGVPVKRLIAGAERVTAGEYGTQVRVSTRDELSDLAGAFNSMSARLLEENQRLIRYQETLEDTVAERTSELTEKNDELEAFVYAASHDLRTPIISLDWLMRELADAIPKDHRDANIERALQRMETNIEGMDQLISDLLELSRIGRTEGDPTAVSLSEIVGAVIEELGPRLRERGVTLDADMASLPTVRADARRMHQVFLNLIENGIKYGRDEGAHMWIRAQPIGDPQRPVKWRIEVADNGPGIPEAERDRIFMLFQRASDPLGRDIQGTGVGLALVRKIIRAYGGDVRVRQAPDGGALFSITLPSLHAPRQRAARPVASRASELDVRQTAPGGSYA